MVSLALALNSDLPGRVAPVAAGQVGVPAPGAVLQSAICTCSVVEILTA